MRSGCWDFIRPKIHDVLRRSRQSDYYDILCRPLDKKSEEGLREFGANVRRERTALEISQQKFSELADLSLRNIQRVEAGEINILLTTVIRIQRTLGCSSEKLIPKK